MREIEWIEILDEVKVIVEGKEGILVYGSVGICNEVWDGQESYGWIYGELWPGYGPPGRANVASGEELWI